MLTPGKKKTIKLFKHQRLRRDSELKGSILFQKSLISTLSAPMSFQITLRSGINVLPGTFDKIDKRASWKIDPLCQKIAIFVAYSSYFNQKVYFFQENSSLWSEIKSMPPGKMSRN